MISDQVEKVKLLVRVRDIHQEQANLNQWSNCSLTKADLGLGRNPYLPLKILKFSKNVYWPGKKCVF